MLDTSFIISIVRGSPEVSHELQTLDDEDLFITSISYFEIFRSREKMNHKESTFLKNIFSIYEVLPFDTDASERSSQIQAKLDRMGEKINVLDVLIAGTMLGHGITKIATKDNDFHKISRVEKIEILDTLKP
ncbi:MAG: type II toxin-antitoxin system VapC family toxin [Cuniculiplasma sp.]